MKLIVKAVIFWFLMAASAVVLWRVIRQEPGRWIPEGLGIAAFVVLVQWFLNRFAGATRKTAVIMVNSALGAVVAGSVMIWESVLFQTGFDDQKSVLGAVIAGAIFVACVSVSVWSFLRLRKSAHQTDKIPT